MKKNLILIFVIIALVTSCKQNEEQKSDTIFGQYVAHLKLDTTLLEITEVATNINIPWDITSASSDFLWYTEQLGTVNLLNLKTGEKKLVLKIPDVFHKKSYGLLGFTIHPKFKNNPYVYLHYTFKIPVNETKEDIKSRIVRYSFLNDTLVNPKILLDSIVGKTYHNGSRLAISPNMKLFFSMGDAGNVNLTQNINHLNGKILRLNLDGSIPNDNPFINNPVWSWGHRNPQGLTFSNNGKLYSSEHGPNNDDEVNLIAKGSNYGWPNVHGFCDLDNEKVYCKDSTIVTPLKAWTPTLGTAGLQYYGYDNIPEWKNALLSVSLKGRALRVLKLNNTGDSITNEQIYFQKRFGRIRDVCVNDKGEIFLATSNRDWHPRYQPWMYDSLPKGGDRIIKLAWVTPESVENKKDLVFIKEDTKPIKLHGEVWDFDVKDHDMGTGEKLYLTHCATCHRQDGKGAKGLIPPLDDTDWVTGDKGKLIRLVLNGLSEPIKIKEVIYEQEMPGFSNLKNEEIADILTYIRNSFGNKANPIIPGEVYEERKQ